jgi:DNA-binding LytR/AlgR family response regulator
VDGIQMILQKIALRRRELAARGTFTIINRNNEVILQVKDIIYCESAKRIVYFHCVGGTFSMYAKLDDVHSSLPACFVRCHQSYVVNFNHVKKLGTTDIELITGKTIPVSQRKKTLVHDAMHELVSHS